MADTNSDTSNDNDQETWLSIGDASEKLSVSRDTLRRWEKVGKVKVYRSPTNRRQYKLSDLEELYKNKNQKTVPSPITVPAPAPAPQSKPSPSSPPSVAEVHTEAKTVSTIQHAAPALAETFHETAPEPTTKQTKETPLPKTTTEPSGTIPTTPLYRPDNTSSPVPPATRHQLPDTSYQTPDTRQDLQNILSTPIESPTSEQTSVLKITAISLAIILIVLGIIITVLIFV